MTNQAARNQVLAALAQTATDPGIDPRTGRTRIARSFVRKTPFKRPVRRGVILR
jgi:hypothetical protein